MVYIAVTFEQIVKILTFQHKHSFLPDTVPGRVGTTFPYLPSLLPATVQVELHVGELHGEQTHCSH